jgi:hypothetical protein
MPSKRQRMWACSRSDMTTLAEATSEHPLKLVGAQVWKISWILFAEERSCGETGLAMRSVPALAIAGRRQAAKTASETSSLGLGSP